MSGSIRKTIRNTPFFSILTPSLNKVKYTEQAIQSVLKQNYPYFEHIILDGGSTDGTIKILKKYKHIKWISEPDKCHINALNKAIKIATGDVFTILNTDDFYEPDAFSTIAKIFRNNKDIFVVVGNCNVVDEKDRLIRTSKPVTTFDKMLQPWRYEFPINPSSYFYRNIHNQIGEFNPKYGLVFDYEFLLRLGRQYKFYYVNKTFGNFRYYKDSKTYINEKNTLRDNIRVSYHFWGSIFNAKYYNLLYSYLQYIINELFLYKIKTLFGLLSRKISIRTWN